MNKSTKLCILCEIQTSHKVIRKNYDFVTCSIFDIACCEHCGIVTTKYELPSEQLSQFYPSDYRNYSGAEQAVQNVIYQNLVKKWSNQYKPKNVFEIGFGRGEMLSLFQKRGVEASGCEMTQHQVDKLMEKEKIVTFVNLDSVPAKRYDLILLYNSLEHLLEIDENMNFAVSRLNTKGVIIVTVPNFSSYQSRILKNKWVHLDAPRHLTHFTAESLCKLMEKHNLIPVRRKKGSIIYDIYGWNEGLIPRQKIQHKSDKKIKNFSYTGNLILTLPRLTLATIISLIARGLGDSALVEIHFQKKSINL